jgi:hypothetical protein
MEGKNKKPKRWVGWKGLEKSYFLSSPFSPQTVSKPHNPIFCFLMTEKIKVISFLP